MATTRRNLHSVAPDERPTPAPKPAPKTIKAAVDMDERALLVALRAKAASEIDAGVPAAYLAPVMRQLREIDREIRALDAREKQEAERGGPVADEAFDVTAI